MNKEQLKRFLIKCCYFYYVKAEPLISDFDYDMRFKELEALEREEGQADTDSPTQIIWGDQEEQYPDWAKIV